MASSNERNRIFGAIRKNDEFELRKLLAMDVHVESRMDVSSENGETVFHLAAQSDIHHCVRLFFDATLLYLPSQHSMLNAMRKKDGMTALSVAVMMKKWSHVEDLLHFGADPDIAVDVSKLPLTICAKMHGDKDIFRKLVERSNNLKRYTGTLFDTDPEYLKIFLEYYLDIKLNLENNLEKLLNAFQMAYDFRVVDSACKKLVETRLLHRKFFTPFSMEMLKKLQLNESISAINWLYFSSSAIVATIPKKFEAGEKNDLVLAIDSGNRQKVISILKDPNQRSQIGWISLRTGENVLHRMAISMIYGGIRLLFDATLRPDIGNIPSGINKKTIRVKNADGSETGGRTPLIYACLQKKWDHVQDLLLYGADPDLESASGVTPIYLCILGGGNSDILRKLLLKSYKRHGYMNLAIDKYGSTLLNPDHVRVLLEVGVNPNHEDAGNPLVRCLHFLQKDREWVDYTIKLIVESRRLSIVLVNEVYTTVLRNGLNNALQAIQLNYPSSVGELELTQHQYVNPEDWPTTPIPTSETHIIPKLRPQTNFDQDNSFDIDSIDAVL